MSRNVWSVLIVALASVGVCAAAENPATDRGANANAAQPQFDSRIDTWVEGSIITLDADGNKFQVRGDKMPYASAYASMMKDMHEKLQNANPGDRQERMMEVRKAWNKRLLSARNEKPADQPSDFSFSLPEKGSVRVLREENLKNADFLTQNERNEQGGQGASGVAANGQNQQKAGQQPIATSSGDKAEKAPAGAGENEAGAAENEAGAMLAFKDLKIGDRVMVGFDSGLVTNTSYVVVKREAGAAGGNANGQGMERNQRQNEPAGANR